MPEWEKRNTLKGNGSILPKIDTIGKDLPCMSRTISREPDTAETLADGSLNETYNNFEEADYTAFSQYLQTAGCAVDDYHVEDGSVIVIQLSNLTGSFPFTYDTLRHIGKVTYPKESWIEVVWATPKPAAMATPKPAATATSEPYSASECWIIAQVYSWTLRWKDPYSVWSYSHTDTYNASNKMITFCIDYRVKNGFDGYDSSYYYITVDTITGYVISAHSEN